MKKLALTSLVAVFAVSGAHAANVINGDPLYRPAAGHFYSVTGLESHSENTNAWNLTEQFGYGITDRLSVAVQAELSTADSFDYNSWDIAGAELNFRVLNDANWKLDIYGQYGVLDVWGDHAAFLDKDATGYGWVAGVRGGYTTGMFTVAGHFDFTYAGLESFDWGEDGVHILKAGVDGLYALCDKLSLVAGVEYTGYTDDWAENDGTWTGTFGVNYNIDATKFIGAYVNATMDHHQGDNYDEWGFQDGFGFGAKFGIDF